MTRSWDTVNVLDHDAEDLDTWHFQATINLSVEQQKRWRRGLALSNIQQEENIEILANGINDRLKIDESRA